MPDAMVPEKGPKAASSDSGTTHSNSRQYRHKICMVSDFFYPRLGGVEMHLWSLSQNLLRLGHKVIVVTHAYNDRKGIRFMTNGLKVYYMPLPFIEDIIPFLRNSTDQLSMPTFQAWLPLFRNILIREDINIVHAHQCVSALTHASLMHAQSMGYHTVYTDHSLFGLNDFAGIHLNKILKFTLTAVDYSICVSHTCRENLVLRASLDPKRVAVIPNAVDTNKFVPDMRVRNRIGSNTINIVVISRLVYRKGIDLLVDIIPKVCEQDSRVNFIIGGDGPKRLLLEEMIEKYELYQRVELLGQVPHVNVREVLVKGHMFLNCSLTESFCIAILEAASCGLYIVSTAVGGIPEILPNDMVSFAERTSSSSLIKAVLNSLNNVDKINPLEHHKRVKKMYHWRHVAERTSKLYDSLKKRRPLYFYERIVAMLKTGHFFGLITIVIVALDMILLELIKWIDPRADIELATDFPCKLYARNLKQIHIEDKMRKN